MATIAPPAPLPSARSLFTLDPNMRHLNHGSVGAVPLPVRQARSRITDELEADPRGFFKTRVERVTAARESLCGFLGLEPERTALVRNTTQGVAQVLAVLNLADGDEVVTTNHGYGAIDFNVDAYVRRVGAVRRVAKTPLNPTADELTEAVSACLNDRTRLVICDHVTSATARLLPVAELAGHLRSSGIPLLVDAAHVPGHLRIDHATIDPDFWVGNLHKWLFAPRGTALLSVKEGWRERMRPLGESWMHEAGFPVATEFNGTDDFTGSLAAPAGAELLRELGVERVREHNSQLVHYGQMVLAEALQVSVDDPERSPMAMRVVRLPGGLGSTTAEAAGIEDLIRQRLRTELAVTSFEGAGLVRIAGQIYNSPADYEALAESLPPLLRTLR